jgi:hypothetical protein
MSSSAPPATAAGLSSPCAKTGGAPAAMAMAMANAAATNGWKFIESLIRKIE